MSKQLITGEMLKTSERLQSEGGFTMLQLVLTATVMVILGTFAFMSITSARADMRLTGSARQFASHVEKARIDAIRRHVSSAAPTKVEFVDGNTYRVTMDWDGSGTATAREFTFETGVSLFSQPTAPITFDWRGRMTACTATFSLSNTSNHQTTIDITGSGDVTVDSDIQQIETVSHTNVNQTVDIYTDATVKGMTAAPTFSTTDCSAVSIGPVGGAIGGGGGGGAGGAGGSTPVCSLIANPGAISIRKNGGTGTVSISVGATATVSVTGTSNLQFTPSSQTVTTSGTTAFTVKSLNNTRGTFTITFTNGCTTTDVLVTVTN
ncbi:MAG TPA: GspH/FimT family pseudopilin [Pyrinomonadaceae bacterium]|jgi:Tfp pilus assembly protein FimT|nr:GspH/FimT family pseudopilin [Pyrinomonadaceae bacterium]